MAGLPLCVLLLRDSLCQRPRLTHVMPQCVSLSSAGTGFASELSSSRKHWRVLVCSQYTG